MNEKFPEMELTDIIKRMNNERSKNAMIHFLKNALYLIKKESIISIQGKFGIDQFIEFIEDNYEAILEENKNKCIDK